MSASITDRPTLVLGAAGLLGTSFSRRACPPRPLTPITRAECDITDAQSLDFLLAKHHPSVIINCAAYTKVDQAEIEPHLAESINVTAVANLARACKQHGTKLIHISTDFVFDGSETTPYEPSHPTNPLSVYGQTKRDGERAIESINPPGWLIARTSWLFGTTGPCFPRTILDRVGKGQALTIVDDQIGCPTYALDLADAICEFIELDMCGIHHVTNSGPCSWFDFAQAVVETFDLPAERIQPITTRQLLEMRPQQAIRPAYSVMSDAGLPVQMRPWRDTLSDFRDGSTPA